MDLRQFQCLIAVAEELNFSRAAERMHIVQSALSRHIMLLEQEIGLRLLSRRKRAPIRLTEAGALFLAAARAAVEHFERAEMVARRLGRGELGKVKVGYVASAAFVGILPTTAHAFRQRWPQVDLDLVEMESVLQVAALAAGEIDVGFFRPRPTRPPTLEALALVSEPVMLAMRSDHPLALGDQPIRSSDLVGDAFVVPLSDDEAGFARHAADIARQGGFTPVFSRRGRDFVSILSLVGVGLGIAPVPASLQCLRPAGVVYRKLADYSASVELVAAFRRNEQSPAVANYIAVIREFQRNR